MGQENAEIHSEYTASSQADLLRYIKQQDVAVPARTNGRESHQCEKWVFFRLLSSWALTGRLSYPLKVVHRDRPDFLLYYNDREVGIEYTEAVSQERAETDALAEHMGVQALLFMDHFKRGTPKRSTAERRQLIREQPHGSGWAGDEPEQELAQRITDCVLAKTKKFNKPDFGKCGVNLLLIYDNLCLPNVELEVAKKYLLPALSNYWREKDRFDVLVIDTNNQLVEISPSAWKCSRVHEAKLWKDKKPKDEEKNK